MISRRTLLIVLTGAVLLGGLTLTIQRLWTSYTGSFVNRMIREGEFEQAREGLRHLLRNQPDSPEAWYRLGRLYGEADQLSLALEALRKARTRMDSSGKVNAALAFVYLKKNNLSRALDFALRSYRHSRMEEVKYNPFETLFERRNFTARELRFIENYLIENPYPGFVYHLTRLMAEQMERKELDPLYERLVEVTSSTRGMRLAYGKFLLSQERPEAARRILEELKRSSSPSPALILNLAEANYLTHRYRRARRLLRTMISAGYQSTNVLNLFGASLRASGNLKQAQNALERSLSLAVNNNSRAYLELGRIQAEKGHFALAISYYKLSTVYAEDPLPVYETIARTMKEKSGYASSVNYYESLIEILRTDRIQRRS